MSRDPLPARLRLRRRLLAVSTPVMVLVLAVAAKLISVVLAGSAAHDHYGAGEIGALGDDVAVLQIFNVIEPANAEFASGALAVLEGDLEVADARFTDALNRTGPAESCPVRVNVALVRERRADIDAWEARLDRARGLYNAALTVVSEAPPGCFAGNDDPDPQRRAVRADTAARLAAKLAALGTTAPRAIPPAPPSAPPPPPPVTGEADQVRPDQRQLDPGAGDPLEVLRRLLEDSADT